MRDGRPRRKAFNNGISIERNNQGQSSVEYAVVLAAFLALVVGLGVMWRFMDEGMIIEHALQSASHHLQDVTTGAWGDVFLY